MIERPTPKAPPTLPPLQDDVVVMHQGWGPLWVEFVSLEELARREQPLWRRIRARLRRRRK